MRQRLRHLGIQIGHFSTGPLNAITDVPGVWVGQKTVIRDQPRMGRTGVTVILPREGDVWQNPVFAGFHALNGAGEMTGIHWVKESGMLFSPVALTNTHQVGTVRDALVAYAQNNGFTTASSLPVVAETWDGWLNDLDAFHLNQADVDEAIAAAGGGPVAEGNVGGGTGMICHDFKGGIGTASRVVDDPAGLFTIGVLVQANHGDRHMLRVDGVPVGREIDADAVPLPWAEPQSSSSIIVIIATDAPLLPAQCQRLAQRATIGIARVGGVGHNGSGDLFLAFSTGNDLSFRGDELLEFKMLPHHRLNAFFEATAEAVEEGILNVLTAAETMTGLYGRTAHALPLDRLQEVMTRYQPGRMVVHNIHETTQ